MSKGATPAQVALAWLLAPRQWLIPIPGTTREARLRETFGALTLELMAEGLAAIDTASRQIAGAGARYSPELERMTRP